MGEVKIIEFGDGDDGGNGRGITSIVIEFASNGVILRFILEDSDEAEVYHSLAEALDRIKQSVGEYREE